MRSVKAALLLGSALVLMAATAAEAATVTISAALNGGAFTTLNSGSQAASFTGSVGAWFIQASGVGETLITPTGILDSKNLDVRVSEPTVTSQVLDVAVASTGNVYPVGASSILSSFTTNLVPTGWTVTETTFLGGLGGTQLAQAVFTAMGVSSSVTAAIVPAGATFTELYHIVTNGTLGTVNNTIDLAAVPIPGALGLFGLGLAGIGFLSRKRKAKSLAA